MSYSYYGFTEGSFPSLLAFLQSIDADNVEFDELPAEKQALIVKYFEDERRGPVDVKKMKTVLTKFGKWRAEKDNPTTTRKQSSENEGGSMSKREREILSAMNLNGNIIPRPVTDPSERSYLVKSMSTVNTFYSVKICKVSSCTCREFLSKTKPSICKHIELVLRKVFNQNKLSPFFRLSVVTESDVKGLFEPGTYSEIPTEPGTIPTVHIPPASTFVKREIIDLINDDDEDNDT